MNKQTNQSINKNLSCSLMAELINNKKEFQMRPILLFIALLGPKLAYYIGLLFNIDG